MWDSGEFVGNLWAEGERGRRREGERERQREGDGKRDTDREGEGEEEEEGVEGGKSTVGIRWQFMFNF